MQWILDHLQLVIIVASAFAWWLSQRREKQDQDNAPPESPMRPEETSYEEQERTRRIQEEIRRKIAERRGERVPPLREEPPVLRPTEMYDPTVPEPPPVPRELPTPATRRTVAEWSESEQAALDGQRRLQEKLRELEEQRRAAQTAVANVWATPAAPVIPSSAGARAAVRPMGERPLLSSLRDKRSLRQVVILREVLDPPVALR